MTRYISQITGEWFSSDECISRVRLIHRWSGIKGCHVCHSVEVSKGTMRIAKRHSQSYGKQIQRGDRISRNKRHALKKFSLDIMHCLHYCADINTNENLWRILLQLPDWQMERDSQGHQRKGLHPNTTPRFWWWTERCKKWLKQWWTRDSCC